MGGSATKTPWLALARDLLVAIVRPGTMLLETWAMPEISRFLGIVVAMYYKEHAPPHFHAKYGGQRAAFSVSDLRLIEGRLPPRVTGLVLEWASQHQEELLENWFRVERQVPLRDIAPLV
jgi:hypothetical protein